MRSLATIPLYDALKKMRQLTELGIPFDIEFVSWNATKGVSEGMKKVAGAILRSGLRKDTSSKADTLIGYVDGKDHLPRSFYLPLLMKLNGINIKP